MLNCRARISGFLTLPTINLMKLLISWASYLNALVYSLYKKHEVRTYNFLNKLIDALKVLTTGFGMKVLIKH